jgi:hypothetical protein
VKSYVKVICLQSFKNIFELGDSILCLALLIKKGIPGIVFVNCWPKVGGYLVRLPYNTTNSLSQVIRIKKKAPRFFTKKCSKTTGYQAIVPGPTHTCADLDCATSEGWAVSRLTADPFQLPKLNLKNHEK